MKTRPHVSTLSGRHRLALFSILTVGVGIIVGWAYFELKPSVLAGLVEESRDVNITAQVPSCVFDLIVYPEKRIPRTGNWSNQIDVEVWNSASTAQVLGFTTTTNSNGAARRDFCFLGQTVSPGTYDFYIKGLSHLRKHYDNKLAFPSYLSILDLTGAGQDLLAGETSIVFDNFINGLDLSTQISNLYTTDLKNDLNRDGQVNSLDLGMTIVNLYKTGD